jgi:hypothetical protein
MRLALLWMTACLAAGTSGGLCAEELLQFRLDIRDHLFYPPEFDVPAGRKFRLQVVNNDLTPEEFESYELNREKVIMGGSSVMIFIGPLAPGQYPFFGEFNPKTAQGKIIAVDNAGGKP